MRLCFAAMFAVLLFLFPNASAVAQNFDPEPRWRSSDEIRRGVAPRYERRRVVVVRPRITVRGRSYLDAGTEVYPGSKHYTDYIFPPGYSGFDSVDPTGAWRYPLPDRFWLPSYGAPTGVGF